MEALYLCSPERHKNGGCISQQTFGTQLYFLCSGCFKDEGAIFAVTSLRHSRGLHKAEFCVSKWVGIDNKISLKHKENSIKQHVYANFSARECKNSVKQLLLKQ